MSDVFKSLQLSRKIPVEMKAIIGKCVVGSSRYKDGRIYGIRKPDGMNKISSKITGVYMGADKDGFFVYTHRCRSKSHKDPLKITKKEIDYIESTG